MTKDKPDWEETERHRTLTCITCYVHTAVSGYALCKGCLRSTEVTCTTCHDFASSSPEVMALHALGCKVEELVPLAVVVEAELLLMAAHAERHGCGCPRHRPWSVA